METRTVEQVEQWESRSFPGGVGELRSLADSEFTGALRVDGPDGTWLFMLNGRGVGVFGGTVDDFERNGTTFVAPEPALPLLYAMKEQGGETQAKYYTNDTPLEEVDDTLSNGGFTGYVELSENVLSGDYYTVYYGGRSMSCAFVGASERLLGNEEAFERANDEVGIYEVKKVSLDIVDLPEPESNPNAGVSATTDQTTVQNDASTSAASTPESVGTDQLTDEPSIEPDEPSAEPSVESTGPDAESSAEFTERNTETAVETETSDAVESEPTDIDRIPDEPVSTDEAATADEPIDDSSDGSRNDDTGTADGPDTEETAPENDEDVFSEEEEWRETTSIPALDPDRSEQQAAARREQMAKQQQELKQKQQTKQQATRQSSERTAEASKAQQTGGQQQAASEQKEAAQKFKQALEESKQEIERLRTRLTESRSKHEQLDEERTRLQNEIDRLRSELEQAQASGQTSSMGSSSQRHLSAEQALDMTNLFIRYGSKGKPTLEDAHDSNVTKKSVNANLQLEHHTQFDTDGVTIEGQEFESFLTDTAEYQFVKWVIEELLYEIRDTGHTSGMRDIFNALPKIDRVELHGSVSFDGDDESEGGSKSFDVILRDRMGNPLAVANLNSSRDPATGEMMGSLVDAANDVKRSNDQLSAAFFVTVSFFEPQALETATEATGGGLLQRDKKESFVKLTRKQGYHLCLVETRASEFHLNVPEL